MAEAAAVGPPAVSGPAGPHQCERARTRHALTPRSPRAHERRDWGNDPTDGVLERFRVLTAYVTHYNEARPQQGLGQRTPLPHHGESGQGPVRRLDVLGGLLHEYYREVA